MRSTPDTMQCVSCCFTIITVGYGAHAQGDPTPNMDIGGRVHRLETPMPDFMMDDGALDRIFANFNMLKERLGQQRESTDLHPDRHQILFFPFLAFCNLSHTFFNLAGTSSSLNSLSPVSHSDIVGPYGQFAACCCIVVSHHAAAELAGTPVPPSSPWPPSTSGSSPIGDIRLYQRHMGIQQQTCGNRAIGLLSVIADPPFLYRRSFPLRLLGRFVSVVVEHVALRIVAPQPFLCGR